jgi:CubicO group peptidase (beta-lactamase class C family)
MDSGEIKIHRGKVDAEPREAGYHVDTLRKLDAHLAGLVREKKLQCASYLLTREGKTFAHASMGPLTHREGGADLMPDSIRWIASITKLFTAVAVMKLMEDGKIHQFQAVSTILDEFKTDMHAGIMIIHLLTHTSGIAADPGYFTEPFPRGWWEGFNEKAKDANWIKAALSGPLLCEPGRKLKFRQ